MGAGPNDSNYGYTESVPSAFNTGVRTRKRARPTTTTLFPEMACHAVVGVHLQLEYFFQGAGDERKRRSSSVDRTVPAKKLPRKSLLRSTGVQRWPSRVLRAALGVLLACEGGVQAANWAQTTGPQSQNNVVSYVPSTSRPHWSGREGMSIAVSNISEDRTLLDGKDAKVRVTCSLFSRSPHRHVLLTS